LFLIQIVFQQISIVPNDEVCDATDRLLLLLPATKKIIAEL